MQLQTKISQKLTALTQFEQPQTFNYSVERLEDLMQVTSARIMPETILPPEIRNKKFPSSVPITEEEREWLNFVIQDRVKELSDPFEMLTFLHEALNELYRHLINADEIQKSENINEFEDLINIAKQLTDYSEQINNEFTTENLENYQKYMENEQKEDEIFILNIQNTKLATESKSLEHELDEYKMKYNEEVFDNEEIKKQRDLKVGVIAKEEEKINELSTNIDELNLIIDDLKAESAAAQLLLKNQSVMQNSSRLNSTRGIQEVDRKCEMLVSHNNYNSNEKLNMQKLESSAYGEDANKINLKTTRNYIEKHFQEVVLDQSISRAIDDKLGIIDQKEAELDLIPQSEAISVKNANERTPKVIGYSRVEDIENKIANGLKFDSLAQEYESSRPDNELYSSYANCEIVNLEEVEYNKTTKEIFTQKKRILPENVNDDNVIFASQKLVEGIVDVMQDDAYALEMKALNNEHSNDYFLAQEKTKQEQNQFSLLKFQIQSHKNALECYLNPALDEHMAMGKTDLVLQCYSVYRQPKCVQRSNSAIQAILNASPIHGNIIGLFEVEVQKEVEEFKTNLRGTCNGYEESMFGASFCSSQRNPFEDYILVNDKLNICEYENIQEEREKPTLVFSKFFIDFLRTNKESANILNLVKFRCKQESSKQVTYNLYGLRAKPTTFLSKYLLTQASDALLEYIDGQELEKAISSNVKKYSLEYKILSSIAAAKTQDEITNLLLAAKDIEITEEMFCLPEIREQLRQKELIFYPFTELLQEIDLIFTARESYQDVIKSESTNCRIYVPFAMFLKNYMLELHHFDENKAQKQLLSLFFSCNFYITYLDLLADDQKCDLIGYDKETGTIQFTQDPICNNSFVLELFMQMINEQLSNQNVEFIVYQYSVIKKTSIKTKIYNHSFISVECAEMCATHLFTSLEIAGISGFVRSINEELIKEIEQYEIAKGNVRIIDIGRLIYVSLKFKEGLCENFVEEAIKKIGNENVSIESYITGLLLSSPLLDIYKQPITSMLKAIYISFAQFAQGKERNLKNLLQNPDYYISMNQYQFNLEIYDYYSEFIPVLRLHKLFYSTFDCESVGPKQEVPLHQKEDQLMKEVSVAFVSQGLGLSPALEPFSISKKEDCSGCCGQGFDAPNSALTYVDVERPIVLSLGGQIALQYKAIKQCSDHTIRMRLMLSILQEFLTGITQLRCFTGRLRLCERSQDRFVEYGFDIIRNGLQMICQNGYQDEISASLGVDFDDSITEDQHLLLSMVKSLVEVKE